MVSLVMQVQVPSWRFRQGPVVSNRGTEALASVKIWNLFFSSSRKRLRIFADIASVRMLIYLRLSLIM